MHDLIIAKMKPAKIPFIFKSINLKVYTFEEACYVAGCNFIIHKNEILTEEFNAFLKINSINLTIDSKNNEADIFINILKASNLFDEFKIEHIKNEIKIFNSFSKSKQYELIADEYFMLNNIDRALKYYLMSLELTETYEILSKVGNVYKINNKVNKAVYYYEKAFRLNNNEKNILENLLHCYIYLEYVEKAKYIMDSVKKIFSTDVLYFYKGKILFLEKEYQQALSFYLMAYEISNKKEYLLEILDYYIEHRLYNKAYDLVNNINIKDIKYILKKAKILNINEGARKACNYLESCQNDFLSNKKLYISISEYKRLSYDIDGAKYFLYKAKALSDVNNNDSEIRLQEAKIKKTIGNQKEYYEIIKEIIDDFKLKYRGV